MNKIALLFPGQGSQTVGMAKDFYGEFSQSRVVFEEASDTISLNLKKLCFDGPLDQLTLTENLQPALFTAEAAIVAAINANIEVHPFITAGHSLGEYAALYAADALSLSDGVKLCHRRGMAMQQAVPRGEGTMAAVLGLEATTVEALCRKARAELPNEVIEPANFNAPGQVVIAGTVDGVAKAVELLRTNPDFQGGKSIALQVSAPFHCSLMEPARFEMGPLLSQVRFNQPKCMVIPNVSAMPTDSALIFGSLLTDQIVRPVRWEESMMKLKTLGITTAIEVGPGKVLTGLMKRINREMPMKNISTVKQMTEAFK